MKTYYIKDKKAPDAYEDDAIERLQKALNQDFGKYIFDEDFGKIAIDEIKKSIDYYTKNGYNESAINAKKKLDRILQLQKEIVKYFWNLSYELDKLLR